MKYNVYNCTLCSGKTITQEEVRGTTPFMIPCELCEVGDMESSFYDVPQQYGTLVFVHGPPTHEWYKPGIDELDGLTIAERDHVRKGGLLLRRISG